MYALTEVYPDAEAGSGCAGKSALVAAVAATFLRVGLQHRVLRCVKWGLQVKFCVNPEPAQPGSSGTVQIRASDV